MSEPGKTSVDLNRLKIDRDLKRSSSKGWKTFLSVTVFIIAVIAGWFLWSKNRVEAVTVTEVRQAKGRQQSPVLNASGYVTPRQRATVAAKITGRVTELFVEEGMEVEKGQVLARLDSTDAKQELEVARAEAAAAEAAVAEIKINRDEAERNLQRLQTLFEKGMVSEQERDTARTTLESLKARIESALKQTEAAEARVRVYAQNLDNYTIRAPFGGIVVSKDAQIGEMISPVSAGGGYTRTGIATIVDMDSLEIEVDINESYIARVTVGQRVTATLDAYPEWKIPASVRTVIPTADRQKATVKVRIIFDALDPKILPDMGVKVAFLEEEEQNIDADEPKLEVRSSAVLRDSDRAYVYVYDGGVIERREIGTGESKNDVTEILSGLIAGDKVVDNPSVRLKDGMKVKVN
ncbi:MAG: efflux RND transporter periplasmic adaptor subunit [Deltaproteobacteria bacterium]|nr:efflux RND transporter periplasmic adaptor subunit [Deltaproteobacteria bacterium]